MISAIASRSRPARCLTRATRSESERRAREERPVLIMTCLYHAVFRAREAAVDARGGARTSPGVALHVRTRAGAFWRTAAGILAHVRPNDRVRSRKLVKLFLLFF